MTYNPEEDIKNTKVKILEELKEELQNIEEETEIYFHDIVTSWIDAETPQDRTEAMQLIDYTGNEQYADEGVLDKSSIDRFLITMAYECLHQNIFNDDVFQELQDDLNNETINKELAEAIIKKIDNALKTKYGVYTEAGNKKKDKGEAYKENPSQIWVNCDFEITKDDFKEPYFKKEQMIDLSDSIKILTNNKVMNNNAVVLEKPHKKPFRIYLMSKDKDIDIRDFFKGYPKTIKENNYSLNPKDYIEDDIRNFKATDKKKFIYIINQMVNKLVGV